MQTDVLWPDPWLSEKFALSSLGFLRFALCSSIQAPGTGTFVSRGSTQVQVGQTVWKKGFTFAAVSSAEGEL